MAERPKTGGPGRWPCGPESLTTGRTAGHEEAGGTRGAHGIKPGETASLLEQGVGREVGEERRKTVCLGLQELQQALS